MTPPKAFLFGLLCAGLLPQSLRADAPCPPGPVWMVVRHDVSDHAAWVRIFDSGLPTRRSAGELSARILTRPGSRAVVGVFEWDSAARALAFIHDPFVRNAMARAGVTSDPVVTFHETDPRGADTPGDAGAGPPPCRPPG